MRVSFSAPASDQLVELLPRHHAVLVFVGPADHVREVLLAEVFSDFVRDSPEVAGGDEAGAFGVEEGEEVVDVGGGVVVDEAGSEQVDELFEGDVSCALGVEVEDELVNGLVAGFRAEGGECAAEF
jgi:hypothetical protein